MEAFIILYNEPHTHFTTINTECVEKYDVKQDGEFVQCVILQHMERVAFTTTLEIASAIGRAIAYGIMSDSTNKEYKVTFN